MKWFFKKFIALVCLTSAVFYIGDTLLAFDSAEETPVFERFIGGEWVYEGPSHHGKTTKTVSIFKRGPSDNSLMGESKVYVDRSLSSTSVALYVLHPRYNRWTYRSVNSEGFVQEAELLEMSRNYFTFKGTAYRPDKTQTTFIWKVTFIDDTSFRSESMA